MKAVVDAFRERGGADKPMFLQVSLSYAPSDDEAGAVRMPSNGVTAH